MINKILDNIINELLIDLNYFGKYYEVIVFYKEKDNIKYFKDYEIASTCVPELDVFSDDMDRKIYYAYIKAKQQNLLVPGYTNIVYEDEKYEKMNIKEAIKLITKIKYNDYPNDSITILTYLTINQLNINQLANMINVSRQYISSVLKGNEKSYLSEDRKKQIAKILNFNYDEYEDNRFYDWTIDDEYYDN